MADNAKGWLSEIWNKAKNTTVNTIKYHKQKMEEEKRKAKEIDAETFDEAYAAARRSGVKTFVWKKNGKEYTTEYNGSPEEQMAAYGITDEQLHDRNIIQRHLAENLAPYGYHLPVSRFLNTVVRNKKEIARERMDEFYAENKSYENHEIEQKKKNSENPLYKLLGNQHYLTRAADNGNASTRLDYFNTYNGIPQEHNTLGISDWHPSKIKDGATEYYYRDNNITRYFKKHLPDILKEYDKLTGNKFISKGDFTSCPSVEGQKLVPGFDLGKYTVNVGKDEQGCYISYYDLWDLDPIKGVNTDFGTPFEVYDRIYFDPQTHQPIDVRPEDRAKDATLITMKNDKSKAVQQQKDLFSMAFKLKQTVKNKLSIKIKDNTGRG